MIFQPIFFRFVISVLIITITNNFYISGSILSRSEINKNVVYNCETNHSLSQAHSRRKRFLIFQGAGVLKMVLGFSEPVNFFDTVPFRQLAVNYAFHLQYSPPTVPVYWWTYFYNSTAWSSMGQRKVLQRHKKSTKDLKYYLHESPYLNLYKKFIQREYRQPSILYDVSRFAVYKAIEKVFNSNGFPGEKCLLRTICEFSQSSFYENNSVQGLLNAIFIPSVENIDDMFLRAKQLGSQGNQCKKIYWSCEDGIRWFQNIIKYIQLNLNKTYK